MSLMRIDDLFHFEKGILQSSKCTEGEFDFITASSEWKTHNQYTHDCEALVFAAAASGSLGRTHYVNGKFISSDLCFIITAKDPIKLPIDLKFYHMIFNEFKNDIVNITKAGTSKEAIGMKAFGNYKLPYFAINKQIDTKVQFVNMQDSKVELNVELIHQLDLIKQLRQAFLREAMQGKLVKSTNTKETGQQLLAKIKAEKSQLIADKKLKKEKELAPVSEDEIPYNIPANWTWCKLGKIISYSDNLDIHKNLSGDTIINYVDIASVDNQSFKIGEIKKSKVSDLSTRARRVLKKDYILYSTVRPYLKNIAIIEDDFPNFIGSTGFNVFKPIVSDIKYLFYFLLSPDLNKKYEETMVGFNSPSITNEQFENTLFPLPPLHEQEQIVAKLEEVMAYCDGLEQSIKESQGYNEMLLQQVLREALQGEIVKF